MPYTNIHWVKLYIKLLNDPRFFTMSDQAQLIYIKFILLCGHFKNKVPRSVPILSQLLRSTYDEPTLLSYIKEIREHFPKVLAHKDFYYIRGFKEMHNRVFLGNSSGTPKDGADKNRIDKEKNKNICMYFSELHKKITGLDYPMSYAKDKTIMYDLMAIYDEATLKTLIDEFFESSRNTDEWWADKLRIGVFKSVIPQLIGKLRKK